MASLKTKHQHHLVSCGISSASALQPAYGIGGGIAGENGQLCQRADNGIEALFSQPRKKYQRQLNTVKAKIPASAISYWRKPAENKYRKYLQPAAACYSFKAMAYGARGWLAQYRRKLAARLASLLARLLVAAKLGVFGSSWLKANIWRRRSYLKA
jgi:hypothetical protein